MSLHVICLCAQWCGTCRDYAPVFNALSAQRPAVCTQWADLDEVEDALGDIDITTFPMLLIADAAQGLCFAGPVTPQAATLLRLCDVAAAGGLRLDADEAARWKPLLAQLGQRQGA
ncbi:MAG: thioredoxin family protein [Hydrogenophaga sp.]|jgi:thiol-disulfide isomerase/thioredoxin|nr:thioredoxin family protein [Hydrogenophaga sp.]